MASGPAADPVAGSSVTPRAAGANIRLRQCRPEPAKQYAATPANPASAVICGFREVTAASSGSATYTCVGPLVYDSTGKPDAGTPRAASSCAVLGNGAQAGTGWRIPAEGVLPMSAALPPFWREQGELQWT